MFRNMYPKRTPKTKPRKPLFEQMAYDRATGISALKEALKEEEDGQYLEYNFTTAIYHILYDGLNEWASADHMPC